MIRLLPVATALSACLLLSGCSREVEGEADAAGSTAGDRGLAATLVAGEEAYWRGEIDSARGIFEATLAEARRRGDRPAEATSLTWLGLAAWRLGDYAEARRLGEAALDLKLRLGLRDDLFRSYNALGLLAWNESRYFEALDHLEKARELAESGADSVNLVKVWTNLALVRSELGDFPRARRLLLRALPLARETGEFEGRVLTNLGMLAASTGDPVAGIGYLEAALSRLREEEDPTGEQNALGQLGVAYAAVGEPGRAIAYLDSALHRSRQQGLRQEEASNLEQLAELFRAAGEHRRALRLFEQARAINARLGFDDETGMDLRSEAEILAELGNLEVARERAERALAIHRDVGSRLEELSDLLLLADLEHRAGDRKAAGDRLGAARRLAAGIEARKARASVALASARIAEREGDPRSVLSILDASAADIEATGHEALWEAHALAARAHARAGHLEAAAKAGRRAVETVERVRGEFASGGLRTSYLAGREDVYRELVEVLVRLGRVEEAFEVADAARGRALVEHRATVRGGGGATARELAEEERQLLGRIDELALLIEEMEGSDERLAADYRAEMDRLRTELERTRSRYASALTRAEEGRRSALLGRSSARAGDARVALAPDEALLEYLVGPDGVRVFVVTREGVETLRAEIPHARLTTRVRLARELVGRSGPDPAKADPVLAGLHRILIDPALRSGPLRGKRTLVVVPHGELSYVPFAALRDSARGRYLAEDFALLHLPSAASLAVLRADRRPRRGVGDPVVFAPFPADLPATAREAEAIRGSMEGVEVVRGRRATEARFRNALEKATIVHAATHGVFNSMNPLFSRILLARGRDGSLRDDGRLEVHEVVSAPVGASLVFLSGCETDVGGARATAFGRGEDYTTLARAFLYAGAANVVATLWRVEDAGAAVFAHGFYRDLKPGSARVSALPVAEALARAQRILIADPRYRAPYYWAGYRLSGSGALDIPT